MLKTLVISRVERRGARRWEAELCRRKGELLPQDAGDHMVEAAACLQQALEVARRQEAKAWKLRVAISLARLWQRQGQRAAARELLTPIYSWFTEGFDTVDVQEARALLAALA